MHRSGLPKDGGESVGPEGLSKTQAQEKLKRLKKVAGNSLLLSAILTHNHNFFCMRLILLVVEPFYLEQAFKAKEKQTPDDDLQYMVGVATGGAQDFLRQVWCHVVCDAAALAQVGVPLRGYDVTDFSPSHDDTSGLDMPGVDQSSIPGRVMRFLCYMIEAHWWSRRWHEKAYPSAFA